MLEPRFEPLLLNGLNAREIDPAFIDHSLSYRENKANLYNQFGIKFVQASNYNYAKYNKAEMLAKMQPKKAAPKEPARTIKPAPACQSTPALALPFDPIARAREVEKLVMRGDARRYYRFRYQQKWWAPSVADSSGCCLSCAFCWNASRNRELPGEYRSPECVAEKLNSMSDTHRGEERAFYQRTGGCEPILGERSLDHLIEILRKSQCKRFLIETNGIILGANPHFFNKLEEFKEVLWIRVCAKAHSAELFEKITGAEAKYFELPFRAVHRAWDMGFWTSLAYMPDYTDPKKLREISKFEGDYDFERLHLYPGTKENLIRRGVWDLRII